MPTTTKGTHGHHGFLEKGKSQQLGRVIDVWPSRELLRKRQKRSGEDMRGEEKRREEKRREESRGEDREGWGWEGKGRYALVSEGHSETSAL